MTLEEMDKKVLALIEELNPNSEYLTDDPDIAAKKNYVTNQIMFEMARFKKIPKYVEFGVKEGELVDFSTLERECGYEVYQVDIFAGVLNTPKANGTVYKIHESGTACVDLFVYPERITENTKDRAYEFELSPDALEIMPYGIAGDLLKSDASAQYGTVYSNRYESMLQRLDPRYQMTSVYIDGGINI